jgi:tripartite-type tricarboxylate transporter receptor subunit TctC
MMQPAENFMSTRRQFLKTSVASAAVVAAPAFAATWPSQPLRIVVPFAAGGTSDVSARLLSKPLSDDLGQPVVVDNRAGAAGALGAGVVANATDGHSVLLSDLGSLAISPLILKDLAYKPQQLQGVTLLAYSPYILAAHPSVPASTLDELVAYSQKKPLNVASAGSGTPNHLGVVELALLTGMKWQHVPYKGGAAAINDTIAGTTQLLLNGAVATYPLVQSGKLKAIGISKRTTMPLMVNVKPLAQQGAKDFETGTYQGVMAPSTMPKASVDRLNAALIQAVRRPEIRARLVELGAEVQTSSPSDTTQWIGTERKRWAGVIERAGKSIEGNA